MNGDTVTAPQLQASDAPSERADRELLSPIQRVADKVSYGKGTPLNIGVWIILVVSWVFILVLHLVYAQGTFPLTWFTSTGFIVPLNLVTTVAELHAGFLVGASSSRQERNLEATLARMSAPSERIGAQEAQTNDVEATWSAGLAQNTKHPQTAHVLTQANHASIGDKNEGNVS